MSTHGNRSHDRRGQARERARQPGARRARRARTAAGFSTPAVLLLALATLGAGFALGRWSGASPAPRPPERGAVGAAALRAGAFAFIQAQAPVPRAQDPASPQELVPLPGGPGNGQAPGGNQGQGQTPGQGQDQAQGNCQLFMFRDGRMFQFAPGQQGQPGQQASPFQGPGNGNPFGGGPGGPQELYPLQPLPSPGQPSPGRPSPSTPAPPQAPLVPPSMTRGPPQPGAGAASGDPSAQDPRPAASVFA